MLGRHVAGLVGQVLLGLLYRWARARRSPQSAPMSLSLICADTSPASPSRSFNLCFISHNIVKLRVGRWRLSGVDGPLEGLIPRVSLSGDRDRRQVLISWGVAMSQDIFVVAVTVAAASR